jgi:RND family efflux transporter MFP subunit
MKYTITMRIMYFSLMSTLFVSCGSDEEVQEEVIRPVRYQQVFSTGGSRVRTFSGVAQFGTESNLSFKVAGTVEKIPVKVGDKVRAGQLLARLDQADYELQWKEAKAARDQARAQEIQGLANLKRVQTLYENRNASKSDLDAATAAYESAHEQDNILKKRRDLAKRQMEYCTLTAPVSGTISEVRVEVNENVNAGKGVLVLTSGSQLEVSVAIPEILISQIRERDQVIVTFDAIEEQRFDATVTEVGVGATGFATTYPVMLRLKETSPEIRAGMAAEVAFTFESSDRRERFIVPPVAVGEDRMGRLVFIVESSEPGIGIAKKKSVTVGQFDSEGLEILGGLTDGDYLVTAGVSKLRDGQKVKFEAAKEK